MDPKRAVVESVLGMGLVLTAEFLVENSDPAASAGRQARGGCRCRPCAQGVWERLLPTKGE